jgi:hypothetical protein
MDPATFVITAPASARDSPSGLDTICQVKLELSSPEPVGTALFDDGHWFPPNSISRGSTTPTRWCALSCVADRVAVAKL